MEELYEPYEIEKFLDEDMVRWVIFHARDMRSGHWPDSGGAEWPPLTINKFRPELGNQAQSVWITVSSRLEKTGIDGLLAKVIYGIGDGYDMAGKHISETARQVVDRVDCAIEYCAGRKEKKETYQSFRDRRLK